MLSEIIYEIRLLQSKRGLFLVNSVKKCEKFFTWKILNKYLLLRNSF